jgi:hypothetical protein
MGGLIFIIPILAFDLWLAVTTGRRQIRLWRERGQTSRFWKVFLIGAALAVWFTFFLRYKNGPEMRVQGFPIPLNFYRLEDKSWIQTQLPGVLPYFGAVTDFITGVVTPFIPFKAKEFMDKVKAELK